MNKTPSFRLAPNVVLLHAHSFVDADAYEVHLRSRSLGSVGLTPRGDFRSKILSWAGPLARPPDPPKTPFLGLPKSRPSPLQKCAKNGVFGRKSVHFRSICAQFCTKMTSFLRT
jgi:hypothetical protein